MLPRVACAQAWWLAALAVSLCLGVSGFCFFRAKRADEASAREMYAGLVVPGLILAAALAVGWWSGPDGWVTWLLETSIPIAVLSTDYPWALFCTAVSWYCAGSILYVIWTAVLLFFAMISWELTVQAVLMEVLEDCGEKVRAFAAENEKKEKR